MNYSYQDYPPSQLYKNNVENEYNQILGELQILYGFYKSSNYRGLNIPSIPFFDRILRVSYTPSLFKDMKYWIDDEFVNVAALAQHYDLPTRMLDWTYDYEVALYFAAIDAAKKCRKMITDNTSNISSMNFCIWMLNIADIHGFCADRLHFVTPSYFVNPNLNAQKGLLSYWQTYLNEKLELQRLPLNRLIENYNANNQNVPDTMKQKKIFKFVINYSHIPDFLYHLFNKSCTAAKYFPGYHGIQMETQEYILWSEIKKYFTKTESCSL
ncbi:MAG: FRG domain-containing protein [Treponematales bacterium]